MLRRSGSSTCTDSCGGRIPARGRCAASCCVPQLAQRACIGGPIRLDLDPDTEPDLAAKARLHLAPRIRRDALERRAALADDDRLVAFAPDEDRGFDPAAPPLLPGGLHCPFATGPPHRGPARER